jgi:trimethylamine-N-oxide reductase (cytochrome c)
MFRPNTYPFNHVIPPELCGAPPGSDPKNWPGKWPALAEARNPNPIKQVIRDVLWGISMDASPDKPIFHRYTIGDSTYLYQYPLPGHSEAHVYFPLGGNYLQRHPNCNQIVKAFMHPKMEFIMSLDPWLEADCMFADLLLPTVTNFERNDVSNWGLYVIYCQKCIPNLGESKSDFDIWAELAKRLGVWEKYTKGPDDKHTPLVTEDDWLKAVYEVTTTLPKYYTWEEFKKKGYHEFPLPDTWRNSQPGSWNWKRFAQDPKSSPRKTESGLIEIYSQSTVKIGAMGQSGYYLFLDPEMKDPATQKYESPNPGPDPLVPGLPTYIPNPEGKGTPTGDKYPIAVLSNHPKYFYHTSYQNVAWLQDEEKMEINGYKYNPIHMNRKDAEERGIKHGDLVRAFNHRGQILCWADLSERFMPGVAHVTYGRINDFAEKGVPGALDKSGNVENICTGGFISPFDNQASVQCVAQVEKWRE